MILSNLFIGTLVSTLPVANALATPNLPGKILRRDHETGFEWDLEDFKVAAIRYPPHDWAYPSVDNTTWVNYDLNKTIEKAVDLIKQAAAEGVEFVASRCLF
ncbi:uncharacterized protein BDV14DRAFT_205358 [Aspergillus stella-maris]|uniref:uncharacterized protein n=1 Tax=Aspergillus stella-maris TaxID=1810926 RepID=UPI003CCCAA23